MRDEDRSPPTPCMEAFDKWWKLYEHNFPNMGAADAWVIFRAGWWRRDDHGC